jgi:uncharacterized protein YtpQ (UPF0354 family)
MQRLHIALLFLAALSVAAASDLLPPAAFAERFAEAIRAGLPSAVVTLKEGELLIKDPIRGKDTTLLLRNAYADYAQDPAQLDQLLKSYVAALRQARSAQGGAARNAGGDPAPAKVDRTRIVPVIKDKQWIDDNVNGLKARGLDAEFVFDRLNNDLVIVYAEDDSARTRYLMSGEDLGVARKELKALAIANLRRVLPKVEMSVEDDVAVISAGGDYDASLLLIDDIWSGGQIKVEGDIVVAIPARNVLLVTGSQSRAGLRTMRTLVAKVAANGSHALTRTLFVYREGRFKKFGR